MSKFKVGDKVRRINDDNGEAAKVGQEATVVNVSEDFVDVVYPGHRIDFGREGEGWLAENAELVGEPSAPLSSPKLHWLSISGERKRTYHFPDGTTFAVENVTHLAVRPTNHRLVTKDGRKFIVPGKFIAIEIDSEEWSA